MGTLSLKRLRTAIQSDAAIRRIQKLQPAGGRGDKIYPPTYPGERSKDPPRSVAEIRRIDGEEVRCVLIDSVQSQANRLEAALLSLMREGRISMPHIAVDFGGQKGSDGVDVGDLGEITSLEAPHRVFDAIIRDSELDGTPFTNTDHYKKLLLAKPTNALQLFELSPTSLVFGVWNSTGEGGGMGAGFTRCIVSEITGVGALDGQKAAIRIDPLGIRRSVKVVGGALDWVPATGGKGEKPLRPSEINHSNIISNLTTGGITVDYALHTAVISCAGLRRLKFPEVSDQDAGRLVLATLALVALTEQDRGGYALRSRCDLVCDGKAPFEIVSGDGSSDTLQLDPDAAIALFEDAVSIAKKAGFPWSEKPVRLRPQPQLVELVALSREQALAGESEADGESA